MKVCNNGAHNNSLNEKNVICRMNIGCRVNIWTISATWGGKFEAKLGESPSPSEKNTRGHLRIWTKSRPKIAKNGLKHFDHIYVDKKQVLRENVQQGWKSSRRLVILDCFPCFLFVVKIALTFFQLSRAYTPSKYKISKKSTQTQFAFWKISFLLSRSERCKAIIRLLITMTTNSSNLLQL